MKEMKPNKDRCGKDKRHQPHWWILVLPLGNKDKWCDGKQKTEPPKPQPTKPVLGSEIHDAYGALTHKMCCVCTKMTLLADLWADGEGQIWDLCSEKCARDAGVSK